MLKVDIENFDKSSLKSIDATNKNNNTENKPEDAMKTQLLDAINQRRKFMSKLSLKIF